MRGTGLLSFHCKSFGPIGYLDLNVHISFQAKDQFNFPPHLEKLLVVLQNYLQSTWPSQCKMWLLVPNLTDQITQVLDSTYLHYQKYTQLIQDYKIFENISHLLWKQKLQWN